MDNIQVFLLTRTLVYAIFSLVLKLVKRGSLMKLLRLFVCSVLLTVASGCVIRREIEPVIQSRRVIFSETEFATRVDGSDHLLQVGLVSQPVFDLVCKDWSNRTTYLDVSNDGKIDAFILARISHFLLMTQKLFDQLSLEEGRMINIPQQKRDVPKQKRDGPKQKRDVPKQKRDVPIREEFRETILCGSGDWSRSLAQLP